MNGQYFNSSGSGNGTPTPPSNSSYPASLSSQSSRDPSPQSRDHGIPSQYGYSNYDQKSSPHLLGNNISNIPLDSSKQQPHGIYSQKMQPFLNSRSQQGLMNHNSPNIANYNVSPASPYANTGTKFNSSFNQPSLYSDMQNNVPNQMSNKSPFQSNQTFTPISKQNDLKPLGTFADSLQVGNVNSQSQLPSTQLTNASQSFQNIPPSSLTNVNLTNSSPSLDQEKIQPIGSNNSNRSPLGYQTGSSDNLLTDLQTSQQPTSQAFNPSISPQSTSRLLNSPPTSSPLPLNPNIPPTSSSSSHSEQQSSSSDQSPALHHTIPTQSSQTVPSSTSNITSPPLQNLFPSSQQGSTGRKSEIPTSNPNAVPPNQQPTLQNRTDSQRIAATVNHIDHVPAEEVSGSGDDQLFKTVNNQDSVQAKPSPHSHQVAHSQSQSLPSLTSGIRPSAQFPSSTQTFGQYSTTQTQPSSLNNFNQPRPQSLQNLPPNVNKSNLGQYNNQYPVSSSGPLPATSVGQNVSGIPPHSNSNQVGPLPNLMGRQPPVSTSTGQQSIPPTSLGSHQNLPPTSIPPYQQIPPTSIGSYQQQKPPPTSLGQSQMPPVSGFGSYQQMPPTGSISRQQMPPVSGIGANTMPPTGPGSRQQIPPPVGGFGSHQQIPPAGLGNQRQMPPPPPTSGFGSHQQIPPSIPGSNQLPPQQPPPINTSSRQYPQAAPPVSNIKGSYPQNQFQQPPPLPNQYSQYQSQNAPIQTQPVSSGQPYGLGRYPPMPPAHGAPMMDGLTNQMRGASITQDGFNRLWGMDTYDLLKTRELLPKERLEAPQIRLNPELFDAPNCSPELFRCTLSKIPETKSLLDKSRLPFGVLIHPFKDLNQLSVVQCSTIVRCRSCRTYINPFVYFVDNKRWKCNLCFRVNELPDEFQFDPVSKTYGDPSRRPEVKFATIEFIAPSEYMVRPPQPAVYLFLFDVSRLGAESGYLEIACQTLLEELENLPGDARTSVGFITYDSSVHFYSLAEGLSQPHQMVVVDIDDMFLPCPDNLLVNLNECYDLIKDLLRQLPTQYAESYNTESALGAALQAAYKLLAPTGGRVTVFQSRLPSVGPGSLTPREDPSQRASDSVPHLNPITDFYKKLALDCSSQQIAVDLFIVNSQYVDIATLSGVSRFSGGCMYHFPLFRAVNNMQSDSLKRTFQRYLTRKIGFESVMRLRCTRGLSIHTFHGNFFVRSTDLLSLPNVNPDAGFGMQVSIDESLSELQNVCFQAALLYTSSNGERRIRVHTLCLPIATNLNDILNGADQQCIIGLLAKMAVDRSIESSLTDAREAFVNVVADILSAYKLTQNSGPSGCVLAASSLRLIPLYILALLKSVAFRTGQCTRLDDRVFAMCQMKSLPLSLLLQSIYPDIYPVHNLCRQPEITNGDDGQVTVSLQRLHLSSEKLDSHGIYLLDNGTTLLMYVGHNVSPVICQAIFGVPHFTALPQDMYELPELNTPESMKVRDLIFILQSEKPVPSCLQIIRDDSHHRGKFLEYLIEDKNEAGTSYYEFLQRIKVLMK